MRHRFFAQLYPLLQAAWQYRYLIVLPVALLPFIATFINGTQPKNYYSHTTILVQETALMNPFLEDLSISYNLEERMEALRVMIHSRYILSEVVESLQLNPSPTESSRQAMRVKLSQNLKLSLAGSDLIKISLNWDKPEQMTDILRLVTAQFLERLQAPGKTSVTNSEQFLRQQLLETEKELALAEQTLSDFKQRNIDYLPQLQSNQNMNVSDLRAQRRETELDLMQAKTSREALKIRLIKSNPIMALLEEERIKAEAQLTILRARYTDNHSKVKAVLRRVNTLREESNKLIKQQQNLSESELNQLWTIAASANSEQDSNNHTLLISQLEQFQQAETRIESLEQRQTALQNQIELLTRQRERTAVLEKELKALERNFEVKEKIYNRLLERYEMAQVTGQLGRFEESDKLKVIDIPYTPVQPTNWPWWFSFILGGIGGAGLGLSLATFMRLIDTRIYSTTQVEQLTHIPTIARIPRLTDGGL
ncbi:sugar transporter [Thaumasiovibrio sp. DFM-14]|uniref:sugar transporter n=1 Tax=Thaumasiovibrio sp. DFM-14 TaxID=3384792 RepID=UPI0039A0AE15